MSAFGENLRHEREMRGVSLEEISAATKISIRFLEAIEREDFSKLPGGIFSRSFIRSYARYLGLDEDRTLAEYQNSAHPQMEFDLHRIASGNAASTRQPARTPIVATIVAVLLLVAGYALFRYSRRAEEAPAPPPPMEIPNPTATAPPAAPANPGNSTAAPGTNAPTETSPGAPTAPGVVPSNPGTPGTTPSRPQVGTAGPPANNPQAGTPAGGNPSLSTAPSAEPPETNFGAQSDLVLQVAATAVSWVSIESDGKTVLQRELKPQEVVTLKAHKSFDVTAGNAQGVILTLNGQTLKPLGRSGEVKHIQLTREDLKSPAP